MLYKYALFLLDILNSKKEAAKYLKCIHNRHAIKTEIFGIGKIVDRGKLYKTERNNIKLVIYEFNSVITYWNLSKSVNNDIQRIRKIKTQDLKRIFGGYDRINIYCPSIII